MKKYRHYPLGYKQRILAEVESGQRSKAEIAREEKISPSLIDRWQLTLATHPGKMIN